LQPGGAGFAVDEDFFGFGAHGKSPVERRILQPFNAML
jgi:hypothetical protein